MPPGLLRNAGDHAAASEAPADTGRRRLRDALARFPTGVVVATAVAADGTLLGMTLNSFTSVSLEPPLVLFCIDRRALSRHAWEQVPGYAINVLANDQGPLSNRFARAGAAKWAGTPFVAGLHGAPLLQGAVARFECSAERLADGGDHLVFIGRVERHWFDPETRPLVFHRGRYAAFEETAGPTPAAEWTGWPLPIHY
jgi:flavin reductase (DIM6/NTAB) family NADH-FMN oxidoreductase RutF